MILCCLIPLVGPDRYVSVKGPRQTIEHCGATFYSIHLTTHGGWPIYVEGAR